MGTLETPSIWRLEFKADPQKHVMLRDATELSQKDFFSSLKSEVQEAQSKEVLVFVHGFDNTFEDAARRTAQLSYDLGPWCADHVLMAFHGIDDAVGVSNR